MNDLTQVLESRRTAGDPDACWLWEGSMANSGYGQVEVGTRDSRQVWLGHRLAFYLANGYLPENVHHRCHVKACVNPNHLEALTAAEHTQEHNPPKSECVNGHSFDDPANVYVRKDTGMRQCLACRREAQKAIYRSWSPRHHFVRHPRRV